MKSFPAEVARCVALTLCVVAAVRAERGAPVRRIRANATRVDRVAAVVHFDGNVRIELCSGSALCPRAVMDERAGMVRCYDGVYAVLVSSTDGSSVAVRSREAAYGVEERILECTGDPEAVHRSGDGVLGMRCRAARMTLDERARIVVCDGAVRVDVAAGSLECERVTWTLDSGEVRAVSRDSLVRFTASSEDAAVHSCAAREAAFDVSADRLYLVGNVAVVF